MILILTFVLIAVIMAIMAVGLLAGRRLRGSCGGLGKACDCANAASCPRLKAPQGDGERRARAARQPSPSRT